MVSRQRLDLEHVKGSASDLASMECGHQVEGGNTPNGVVDGAGARTGIDLEGIVSKRSRNSSS